jgi:hypothetical protein
MFSTRTIHSITPAYDERMVAQIIECGMKREAPTAHTGAPNISGTKATTFGKTYRFNVSHRCGGCAAVRAKKGLRGGGAAEQARGGRGRESWGEAAGGQEHVCEGCATWNNAIFSYSFLLLSKLWVPIAERARAMKGRLGFRVFGVFPGFSRVRVYSLIQCATCHHCGPINESRARQRKQVRRVQEHNNEGVSFIVRPPHLRAAASVRFSRVKPSAPRALRDRSGRPAVHLSRKVELDFRKGNKKIP